MTVPFDRRRDVRYGIAETILPMVRRVTCANPSAMTFTGTRTYVVGEGRVAIVDPGPDNPSHLAALLAALAPGEAVAHIVLTHTHTDHSAGAGALARATGAGIAGFGRHRAGMSETMLRLAAAGADLGGGEGADHATVPTRNLADGDTLEGEGWALTAIHTPGHLSNHISLALEGTGALFTGDTVMGWATTLVSPPEGDMAALMASLEKLRARGADMLLPGHGHPVTDPAAMLDHQIAHRKARAASVLASLANGPASAADLAREIYTDTDPALLPAAARNVFATLIGLMDEGQARALDRLTPAARFERI